MWVREILVVSIVILVRIWLKARRKRMSILQNNGIPVPVPNLIWGNLREYQKYGNVIWDTMITERFGPICGYYLGAKPMILVTDLALLRKIQSTEGEHYLERPRRVPGGINPDVKRSHMLGNLPVSQWKQVRTILSRGFTPDRLRNMFTDARSLVTTLLSCFPHCSIGQTSEPFDFYPLFQNFTLDLIGKSAFGLTSDIQRNPNDALKAAVQEEFSKSTASFLITTYLCFPELGALLQRIRVVWEQVKQFLRLGGRSELWSLGLETVCQRKSATHSQSHPQSDLLQLMVSNGGLSEIKMVANCVLFFEAAFETLSASLAFIVNLLMAHPHIQENLRNEIKEVLKETGGLEIDMGLLSRIMLLDAVIKEGLRMYPPQTTFIGRSGDDNLFHVYTTPDGSRRECTIPRQTHIQVGLYQILNCPRTWDAPREFRPQRFLTELTWRQKLAYQPFGKGKRICIGKKYADMVLKLVLTEILLKYKIIPRDESNNGNEEREIDVVFKTATMTPKNGTVGRIINDPLFS